MADLTILQALQRSRRTLLFDALPLFSSSTRQTPTPQPHTTTSLSEVATVSIGPHTFARTKVSLVHWTDQGPSTAAPSSSSSSSSSTAAPPATNTAITPALIMRLNAASATDPLLATILRKAAAGTANAQELTGLSRYIEAIRDEVADTASTATTTDPVASTSAQPAAAPGTSATSIVVEFRESSTEQFLLPTHFACSVVPDTTSTDGTICNVLLSFFVFPGATLGKGKGTESSVASKGHEEATGRPVPVDLIVEECDEKISAALLGASRTGREKDPELEAWWLKMVASVAPRVFVINKARLPTPEPEVVVAQSPAVSRAASFAPTGAPAEQSSVNGKRPLGSDSASPAPRAAPNKKRSRNARRSGARPSRAKSVQYQEEATPFDDSSATGTPAPVAAAPSPASVAPAPATPPAPSRASRRPRRASTTGREGSVE